MIYQHTMLLPPIHSRVGLAPTVSKMLHSWRYIMIDDLYCQLIPLSPYLAQICMTWLLDSQPHFASGNFGQLLSIFFRVWPNYTNSHVTHEVWYFAFPGLCPKFYDNKCMCFDVFSSVCIILCFINQEILNTLFQNINLEI